MNEIWYSRSLISWLLLPFSLVFYVAVAIRRLVYQLGLRTSVKVDVPVIIVGNISVGGTGKTPVTIWLAHALKEQGYRPAIVSRGYGGNVGEHPVVVTPGSDTDIVGDEAVVLASRSQCPVVVHPDRVAAARKAVSIGGDVIVSDDGLQHYRLQRDVEIIVVDGERGFGNGWLIPAGPLREPLSRMEQVDAVVAQCTPGQMPVELPISNAALPFALRVESVRRISDSTIRRIDEFAGTSVHAIAGIGHPERFFRSLESRGIQVIRHPLPDHSPIAPADVDFGDGLDVLMTEKDAVKCRAFETENCWYVPADVEFEAGQDEQLLDMIRRIIGTQ